jgi:hypothetical protein
MAEEAKRRRGRPDKVVDLKQVRALAAMHCTGPEIASVLGISFKEFENRRARRGFEGAEFRRAYDDGRKEGAASLRRAQWKTALGTDPKVDAEGNVKSAGVPGNPYMQTWLGKQYLEQRETFEEVGSSSQNSLWQLEDMLKKRGPTLPVMRPVSDERAAPEE